MKEEIQETVIFITRLIGREENLPATQLKKFQDHLFALLKSRYEDHWFPDSPTRGQAYRCLRVNSVNRKEPIIEEAASRSGLSYIDLMLPRELTVWVDPGDVSCRFGETEGSVCPVASIKNGKLQVILSEEPSKSKLLPKSVKSPKKSFPQKSVPHLYPQQSPYWYNITSQPLFYSNTSTQRFPYQGNRRCYQKNDRFHWVNHVPAKA